MKKIKIDDQEFELEDNIASMLVDETGVPFKNRAAEWRRKTEKMEKQEAAMKEALEKKEKEIGASQKPPYTPGVYGPQVQPQPYVQQYQQSGPQQYGYQYPAYPAEPQPTMTPAEIREEVSRQQEYVLAEARLKTEWKDYDEHRDSVKDYLRTKGYRDEQIDTFGPIDLLLVKDGFEGQRKRGQSGQRTPQEVYMEVGAAGSDEINESPFNDPDKMRNMPKEDFRKMVSEAKMKPFVGDE